MWSAETGADIVVALRRLSLIVLALVVPPVVTLLLYRGTVFLLASTSRAIDPQVLHFAAIVEFGAFLFLMLLELKNRW